MKKIFFVRNFTYVFALVCAVLSVTNKVIASEVSLGGVGVDKISVVNEQGVVPSIKINATFFNLNTVDQSVIVETSITDNYSLPHLANIDKLTSDVLDTNLIVPKQAVSFAKSYTYTLPNLIKKNTYRVELRVLDKNRNVLYYKQSDAVTLGNDTAVKLSPSDINSWFEYDGKKYRLQDGPIVKAEKKDTAFYVVEVNNTSNESLSIETDYGTRKYASTESAYVANEPVAPTVIPKKTKKVIKIAAKYIDQPGTYEGNIDVYGTIAGNKVILKNDNFRYMIGDVFIVVSAVNVSTSSINLDISKTLFDSTVVLTEDALNDSANKKTIDEANSKEYTFTYTYKDSGKATISTQSDKIKWSDLNPTMEVPVVLTDKEKGLVTDLEISITDDSGKSVFKNIFGVTFPIEKTVDYQMVSMIACLVLLMLSLIGFAVTRKKIFIVLILLFLAGTLFVKYSKIFATTAAINSGNFTMSAFADGSIQGSNLCWSHGYRGLTMSINSYPSPSDTFQCGQTVAINAVPTNSTCSNTPSDTGFQILATNGLTVNNTANSATYGTYVLVSHRNPNNWNLTTYPISIKINPGFTGDATVRGTFFQVNGACNSQSGQTTFTFKSVGCTSSCVCSNRSQVCTTGGVSSTTPNSPACFPQASCGVSVSGDQATFTTTVTQGLGAISYKDTGTGSTITNPITKTIPLNGSVTQNTTITDAFDGLTAFSSCTAYSNGQVEDTNSTSSPASVTPRIFDFMASPSIVEKGNQCKFSWTTEGMSLCSFKVNNLDQSGLSDDGKTGTDVSINTTDGNNKNGLLTCISSSTPAVTVTASTTCRVNPEVRQQ